MYDPEQVATYYAALFPARSDVYSAWTPEGWRPVREPLTAKVVLDGLSGTGPSISGFMIAPGNQSHSFAIDFDTDDGLAVAFATAKLMAETGIYGYVERSRRGAHLWGCLSEVAPAVAIRFALHAMLQRLGRDGDSKIELRPGSDTIGEGGLGHALRLPLMPHPVTGKRGRLLDASGAAIGSTLAEMLLNYEWSPVAAMLEWSEKWIRPPVAHISSDYRETRSYPEDTSTASDVLREYWGVANAAPGRSVRCPAHEDKMSSLSILRDDKRAICKSPSCVLHNDGRGRGTYELKQLAPRHE